jgi:integrase
MAAAGRQPGLSNTKGGRPRTVPLSPEALAIFFRIKDKLLASYCKNGPVPH